MESIEQKILNEVKTLQTQEQDLTALAQKLNHDPKFAMFLEAQKAFNEYQAQVWTGIQKEMIENDIRSIKTDKITLTIATRTSYDIDETVLPAKFWKKVPDTTKIATSHKLEGKPVKGTTPKQTQYLTKRGVK